MQDGSVEDIFTNAERSIKQMAACGLSHSAKAVKQLLTFAHALEKNQRAFIELTLRQQRTLKKLYKYMDVSSRVLTRKQERQIIRMLEKENAQ